MADRPCLPFQSMWNVSRRPGADRSVLTAPSAGRPDAADIVREALALPAPAIWRRGASDLAGARPLGSTRDAVPVVTGGPHVQSEQVPRCGCATGRGVRGLARTCGPASAVGGPLETSSPALRRSGVPE